MRCVAALTVLSCAIIASGFNTEHDVRQMKSTKGKYCGSQLSNMLSLVCDGVYNNKQKKSLFRNKITNEDYDDVNNVEYTEEAFLPMPFRSKEQANSLLSFRKRNTIGIVNECCHKSCSLWEMVGYCG